MAKDVRVVEVLFITQIEYPPKTEFGIKAVSNVILVKGSWIPALLVMHQTMKSIVPVCKNFYDFQKYFYTQSSLDVPKSPHFHKFLNGVVVN